MIVFTKRQPHVLHCLKLGSSPPSLASTPHRCPFSIGSVPHAPSMKSRLGFFNSELVSSVNHLLKRAPQAISSLPVAPFKPLHRRVGLTRLHTPSSSPELQSFGCFVALLCCSMGYCLPTSQCLFLNVETFSG